METTNNNTTTINNTSTKDLKSTHFVLWKYLAVSYFTTVILATVIGNSMVLAVVIRYRRLRSGTNIILASLACTDLVMVVVMIFYAVQCISGRWLLGETTCSIIASLGLNTAFISILHLCCVSCDRYVAIKMPFQYPLLITRRRVTIVLVFLWVVPSIALNLGYADFEFRSTVFGCSDTWDEGKTRAFILVVDIIFIIIPFVMMMYTQLYVCKVAQYHAREVHSQENSVANSDFERPKPVRTVKFSTGRELKSVRTFTYVIGAFVVCYAPFFVAGTYVSINGKSSLPDVVLPVTIWIAFTNNCCNPIVYGMRHNQFRKAFLSMCCARVTIMQDGPSRSAESRMCTQATSHNDRELSG